MKYKPKHRLKAKGSILAALDIGSSKMACFIARVIDDEGHFEVLGIGHQASAGVKAGTIVDMNAAETALRRTVHAAENMAAEAMKGYPLREVVINVPGILVKSNNFSVGVKISGQDVTDNDVNGALAKAQEQIMGSDNELIHNIPMSYTIDGHNGIRDPSGMFGDNMDVDIHLVTGERGALRNIATCVESSHLDVESLCVSSYAAGLACLVEDEMDLGCTVIDMGGGVTSIAVFQGGNLVYVDALPLGGQHVTNDIATGLTTSLTDAERIKTLYGSAMGASSDENEVVDVPPLGEAEYSQPNHVPRSLLIGVIQPRMEEILEMVRAKLNDSGLGGMIGRRVVLTGGASQMSGVRELAQVVLDKQVRLGMPIRVSGLAEAVNGPAFATTAGLLTYMSERSHEIPAEILAQVEPGNMWGRVKYWLRENW